MDCSQVHSLSSRDFAKSDVNYPALPGHPGICMTTDSILLSNECPVFN